jgi:hypothetical protein
MGAVETAYGQLRWDLDVGSWDFKAAPSVSVTAKGLLCVLVWVLDVCR